MDNKHKFNIGYVVAALLLLEKETLTPDDFAPLRRTAELVPAA